MTENTANTGDTENTANAGRSPPLERVDVAIVGAGPVGLTLALALAESPLKVQLIDRQAAGAWQNDPRALALAHGSRQLLETLAAWPAATPIHDIHVSQSGGFGQTTLASRDYALPALGYVARYRDLAGALAAALAQCPAAAPILSGGTVQRVEAGSEQAILHLQHGGENRTLAARLVVHAEGSPADDPALRVHDYRQQAIVAEVRPRTAHGQRAWERFTPDGSLALLPLGTDYAVVHVVPAERAAALLHGDDRHFLDALRNALAGRIDFIASGPRSAFPLALRVRRDLCQARQAWIGNAAQTLHPLTGQGFNLGLRDAWQLAGTLLDHTDGDIGAPAVLQGYCRQRRLDRSAGIGFTDGLVRLFSSKLPPLRLARGLGLLALDLQPALRHFVARRMIWGARAWP